MLHPEQISQLTIKDIPEEIRPSFARVVGEVIGYNREVMNLYGEGENDNSVIKKLQLVTADYINEEVKYGAIAVSNGGVSGAGNKFMLEGSFDEVDLGSLDFSYDLEVASYEKILGEFDLTAITKRHKNFVTIEQ